MKNLQNYGVQKLNSEELVSINGGYEYADFTWSGTGNPIVFAGEAAYNAGVCVYNAGVWIANLF